MSHYDDKFFLAVQLQEHETIERLIDKVDVNARNGNALTVAANKGDYETVKFLLMSGADVDKSKALLIAAQSNNMAIVELLLSYGATNIDFSIKAAAKKKSKEILWTLINNTTNNSQYHRLSKNVRLMETINQIFNCQDLGYQDALMQLITDDDIDAIEEITETDLLERLQALKPKPMLKLSYA